ncbi:2-hydroxy-3-keto-5-methylthiopentenyl-1-phosphate phosphatase [Paenibacillus sp. GSMTC-2017]|uniref:2-hydroxy-3-keto-5-methylthiopentenyl-1- phosphate phosphatase n=1 Tax=Paenibacillus sp. GSMTC-2017 TaxID=2794350 RepID=UPI0018D5BD45|nr:2-hydroxy-3-keto-5-methylthiopentenyl-1-phosphate phosphatase [Paenibacillus sp. GSMTC-2017]MBH5317907.1 2-hydroxy-3-keto-5-methylthiopentenyl-1-phosphate phosphatase [Paenibacillus sp. GSMTC-2017]
MTNPLTTKKRIVFCDFDGTITVNDNIIAIIKHFNPAGWEEIATRTISTELSIKDGVGQLFRLIPASMQNEVVSFGISNAKIREGFAEFLAYCKKNDIDFYVTSGGIEFFVYPILESFDIPRDHIYCNASDFTGKQIEILWPHPCDGHCSNNCGMCKTTIMRNFPADQYERIIIGDSVTDFEGAKLADAVYSRSHLTTKCKELGIDHKEYETFFDIIDAMNAERKTT